MAARNKNPETRKAIAVIGPKRGLRRAGIRFGPEPVILTEDDITEQQAQAIAAEPALMVSPVEIPVEQDAGGTE